MNGYYLYMIFIEKYVTECRKKDLEDLEKTAQRVADVLNNTMGNVITSRYFQPGVVAVLQQDTQSLGSNLCMNRIEMEMDRILTMEYQTNFLYADYSIPEDHIEMMMHAGILQYEHSYMVPNNRRGLEVGVQSVSGNGMVIEDSEFYQLKELVLKGDYEQARFLFTKLHSDYQNGKFQKKQRMHYRIGMMNLIFSMQELSEEDSESIGRILFSMPMARTWHRYILSEIYRICQAKSGKKELGFTAGFLQKVRMYIDDEISNPNLNLKMAADAFGLTPSYFSTIFKKNMQMNFLSYVENKRMNIGYALLAQGDTTVEKVAMACGYENVRTFRRNFKAFYDRNPVEVLNADKGRA